jgi:nicotinamidase-related amidase
METKDTMTELQLAINPKTTALITIDLQHYIVGRELHPHSSQDVVKRSASLAKHLRDAGATIIYVRVNLADMLDLPVDKSFRDPSAPPPAANASEIVPESGMQPGDKLITKRQWGAFFGTDLEKQLRDAGIRTVVITGIATNYGVESTARAAAGLGFEIIVVEDACSTLSDEFHKFAFDNIFPRLGRVRSTQQVIDAVR